MYLLLHQIWNKYLQLFLERKIYVNKSVSNMKFVFLHPGCICYLITQKAKRRVKKENGKKNEQDKNPTTHDELFQSHQPTSCISTFSICYNIYLMLYILYIKCIYV